MTKENGAFLVPREKKWVDITQLSALDTALTFKWQTGQALGFPNACPSLPTGESTFLKPIKLSPAHLLKSHVLGYEGKDYRWCADFSKMPEVHSAFFVMTMPFLTEDLPEGTNEFHQIYYFQDLGKNIMFGTTTYWENGGKHASKFINRGIYSRQGSAIRGGIPLTPPIPMANGIGEAKGPMEVFTSIEEGFRLMAETAMNSTLHVFTEERIRTQSFWDEFLFR